MNTLRILFLKTFYLLLVTSAVAQSPKVKAVAKQTDQGAKTYQVEVTVENIKGIKYSVPGVLINEYD